MIGLSTAKAHEWTPTYPKLVPSYVDGVLRARMQIYNNRKDIEYYEISVYDENWNPIKFAVSDRIVRVRHLQRKTIDVHIRKQDEEKATYICTRSKILSDIQKGTNVASRICSKIK